MNKNVGTYATTVVNLGRGSGLLQVGSVETEELCQRAAVLIRTTASAVGILDKTKVN